MTVLAFRVFRARVARVAREGNKQQRLKIMLSHIDRRSR